MTGVQTCALPIYKNFYENRDFFSESYFCQNTQETKINIIHRKEPGLKEDYLKKSELFFLNMYLKVLNADYNFKFSISQINKIFEEVAVIYSSTLDKKKALVYISESFQMAKNGQFIKQNKSEN